MKARLAAFIIALPFLFLLPATSVEAQSSYPYALETVTFNAETKRADRIPFDKPFRVEIEKLSTQGITKIFVYEMIYNHGTRCFKRATPDITIPASSITIKDQKVSFEMPALKPQKHFEIVIIRKETDPYGKTLQLNKTIFENPANRIAIESLFQKLKRSYDVTGYCNLPASSVIPGTVDDYLDLYYHGIQNLMEEINRFANLCRTSKIDEGKFAKLIELSRKCCKAIDTTALLLFCNKQTSMDFVCKGLTRLQDIPGQETDKFDLQKRIGNLESSINTVSVSKVQVQIVLNEILNKDISIICDIDSLIKCLTDNKKALVEQYEKGTALLDKKFYSSNNLISTTVEKDLQVESANRFLLDLGFANIGVADNRDKFTYIPKLAWGLNILFRPVDKKIPLHSLPGTPFSKGNDMLLAKKSLWHYVSLYIGFTISEITEPEFDDFYNKTSLMIGPSFRLYRAVRVSLGAAFLRAVSTNPIADNNSIVVGGFANLSVDIDLLKTINSITSLLTK